MSRKTLFYFWDKWVFVSSILSAGVTKNQKPKKKKTPHFGWEIAHTLDFISCNCSKFPVKRKWSRILKILSATWSHSMDLRTISIFWASLASCWRLTLSRTMPTSARNKLIAANSSKIFAFFLKNSGILCVRTSSLINCLLKSSNVSIAGWNKSFNVISLITSFGWNRNLLKKTRNKCDPKSECFLNAARKGNMSDFIGKNCFNSFNCRTDVSLSNSFDILFTDSKMKWKGYFWLICCILISRGSSFRVV